MDFIFCQPHFLSPIILFFDDRISLPILCVGVPTSNISNFSVFWDHTHPHTHHYHTTSSSTKCVVLVFFLLVSSNPVFLGYYTIYIILEISCFCIPLYKILYCLVNASICLQGIVGFGIGLAAMVGESFLSLHAYFWIFLPELHLLCISVSDYILCLSWLIFAFLFLTIWILYPFCF